MAQARDRHYPGAPGTRLYIGIDPPDPDPGEGTLFKTLTLVNESGSTQAANFVTPMFGVQIKQGEVPAGEYPQFQLADETPCPATMWNYVYWPDGSMKFCGAMVRIPVSVAGSGSLALRALSGGSAPVTSARSLSDASAADLKLEVVGSTNLSGTWVASLNDAITDAIEIVEVGNGPAGRIWRVLGRFKQSSSPHAHMVCYHYFAALQNSSGGLLGLRYLGRAAQPWADVSSATSRVMSSVLLKSGASTIRTIQGTNSGESVSNTVFLDHYSSFFTAGTDGRYDYVQGGGSGASECTIRVTHDPVEVVRTRLLPPYNTAGSYNSNSSVNYSPNCRGHMQRHMPGTGERDDIAVFPSWYVRHLHKQTAVDERAARVNGLAAGGWRICCRQSDSRNVIACVDIKASYSGMGTMRTSWRHWPQSYETGMVEGATYNTLWQEETEPSHRPSGFYYPYLMFGEPQYLDMAVEMAAVVPLNRHPNTQGLAITLPISNPLTGSWGERSVSMGATTYKGAGILLQDNVYRLAAWSSRDLAHGIALTPNTGVYAGPREYFTDVLANNYTAADVYNNYMSQDWRDSGLWSWIPEGANDRSMEGPWALGYLSNSVCHQASILPDIGAQNFRQHLSRFYAGVHNLGFDVACIASYRMPQHLEDGKRFTKTSDLVFMIDVSTLTFSTSTHRATLSGTNGSWTPTNGDVFMFHTHFSSFKPFSAAVNGKRLYAVNCSGQTFQLAATPGGAPINVTNAGSVSTYCALVQNFTPRWSFENYSGASAYVANMYGVMRHHQACGDSNIAGARARQDTLVGYAGTSFANDPKNAMAFAYPE